jgi:hypothetical protein
MTRVGDLRICKRLRICALDEAEVVAHQGTLLFVAALVGPNIEQTENGSA